MRLGVQVDSNYLKKIVIRNYRAISSKGASIPMNHEFTSIIGVNNSGKTTILRFFYEARNLFRVLAEPIEKLRNARTFLASGKMHIELNTLPGERYMTVRKEANPIVEFHFAQPKELGKAYSIKTVKVTIDKKSMVVLEISTYANQTYENLRFLDTVNSASGKLLHKFRAPDSSELNLYWQPVTRSFQNLANAFYIGPFRNSINSGSAKYYDIEIGQGFIDTFDNYKNGDSPEHSDAVSSMENDLADIFGFKSLEINPSNDNSTLIVKADNSTFRTSEFGAGFTQFIIVASNVLIRKPSLLLIDEPELNLHASLQLKYLSLLAGYAKNGIIFSTHSLGLAKSASDHICVSTRSEDGTSNLSDYQTSPSLASTLGALGYGGINDSAYSSILLVEGTEDVRVFQQLLNKYGVRNEVVIVPLGGDSLATGGRTVELSEIQRLSDNIYAVVDSEKENKEEEPSSRRKAFKKDCDELGIYCTVLERRAIENYLSLNTARAVFKLPNAPDFDLYDKPSSAWSWSKEKNWRIAQQMTKGELQGTDLDIVLKKIAKEST